MKSKLLVVINIRAYLELVGLQGMNRFPCIGQGSFK